MRKALYRTFARVFGLSLLGVQFVAPPCFLAADLEAIAERGHLVVAVKDNVRPMGFRDQQGNLQGLEIDLARRLAQDLLGRPDAIVLKPVSNRDRLSVVMDGQVDLTIARVTATASRSRVVAFSMPYYMDGTGIITRNPTIQTQANLANQTVAVLNEASTIATIRYQLPQVKLVGVESYEAGRRLLESGQAVAFAADISILQGWTQELPDHRVLPLRLSSEPLSIVVPKGVQYDELRRRIDRAITRWKTEGWLQERATYWGLPWDTLKSGG